MKIDTRVCDKCAGAPVYTFSLPIYALFDPTEVDLCGPCSNVELYGLLISSGRTEMHRWWQGVMREKDS